MKPSLAVVMDPIESINIAKDSTFAMLLEAQARGWNIYYLNQADLYIDQARALCMSRPLRVFDNPDHWFEYDDKTTRDLSAFDVILMRKDPPFDMEYIYTTYILDMATNQNTLVVNRPSALRTFNEKAAITTVPQCCAPFCITRNQSIIYDKLKEYDDCVIKPLDGMGGKSIFRLRTGDDNVNAIVESLAQNESRTLMVQKFIPEITAGDKRVLLINGKPIPYALARIPKAGDFRGNLATGGSYQGVELNKRDRWICAQLEPILKENGLMFVGIDIIGDYLTEINVTSPTCIRELDRIFNLNIAGTLFDAIDQQQGNLK